MAGRIGLNGGTSDELKRIILATDVKVDVGGEIMTVLELLQKLAPYAKASKGAPIAAWGLSRCLEYIRAEEAAKAEVAGVGAEN